MQGEGNITVLDENRRVFLQIEEKLLSVEYEIVVSDLNIEIEKDIAHIPDLRMHAESRPVVTATRLTIKLTGEAMVLRVIAPPLWPHRLRRAVRYLFTGRELLVGDRGSR